MIITRSGLVASVAAVQTFFAANGLTSVVEVGWLRRDRADNQGPGGADRVIFTPSDDNGASGTLGPARFPGDRNVYDANGNTVATVRSLADWERRVLVSVWAGDGADRTNETLQIEAVETLLEWVIRAVHSSPGAFASAQWSDVKWTPPETRPYGLELRATLTYRQPFFDVPRDLIRPTSGAVSRATYTPPAVPTSHGDT